MHPVVLKTAALAAGAAGILVLWLRRRGDKRDVIRDGADREMGGDLVGHTSQLMAASRAAEAEREEPLFVDALAKVFAGSVEIEGQRGIDYYVSIRTKYFDDWMMEAVKDGRRKQVVLLGSGMDARAYRLCFPAGVTVFEVDQELVQRRKEDLIATVDPPPVPKCSLRRVGADVSDPALMEQLALVGYDSSQPSAWLFEGLVYYLSETQNQKLFTSIRDQPAADTTVAMDLLTTIPRESANPVEAMFQWSCADPGRYFSDLGFAVEDKVPVGSEKANYGRWNSEPLETALFVTAGKVSREA